MAAWCFLSLPVAWGSCYSSWAKWWWLLATQPLQTQKQHFLQQWNSLDSARQKWHGREDWNLASLSLCSQQQVSKLTGLHSKQQYFSSYPPYPPSTTQNMHFSFMIFCCLQLQQRQRWSSGPAMQVSTWSLSHFVMIDRFLSPVTVLQQSKQSAHSLTLQSWSKQYQSPTFMHRMHPYSFCSFICGENLVRLNSLSSWSLLQVLSFYISISLQLRQQCFWQLGHFFGHSFFLVQMWHVNCLCMLLISTSSAQHRHLVLILTMSSLGLEGSKYWGKSAKQPSQMPKLHRLSSQTPPLLTEVLMPHISQMKLRLAIFWKLYLWPKGQLSLVQGGTLQLTQQSSSQMRQQDLQSCTASQQVHFECSISSQVPMKNQSWCPCLHLQSSWSCFWCSSSGGTKWHSLQCI